jgi:phosphoenolpyruvate carboxykinase (ATP)
MVEYNGELVLKKASDLMARSRRVGTNVTLYTGPELGRLAFTVGQRNIFGGYNWDTKVKNRSARYTLVLDRERKDFKEPYTNALATMDSDLNRIFGGEHGGKKFAGHANQLPIDFIHRVMGSGEDKDFTFNCNLLVSTKNRANHHIAYMWGKMCREVDPVKGVESLCMLMVPDISAGEFGRFYCWPEQNVTLGVGSDYMGEAKKGMLRMAMYKAKRKGILGVHAGTKIVAARSAKTAKLQRLGIVIFGNSGTGKTTNVGHSHYLDIEDERSLVVQDDFAGLRLKDGRILGTEQAMFLKTDLDADDVLLRPLTESSDFLSQNLYLNYKGEIQYLEEDLCANGRAILPLRALPKERRFESIDFPPLDEMDSVYFILNTRRNTVVPILQELTAEQCAAYFMLGESIETAAGDPSQAGRSIRVVGTNPFIVGDFAQEGNLFYEYLKRYGSKIRCFLMNTGGVGELPNPADLRSPLRPPSRPWKNGIGYITRALFRDTATWSECRDFGTRVLTGGVSDEHGKPFDMNRFDPNRLYDAATREALVATLKKERAEYMEQFPGLDPHIKAAL